MVNLVGITIENGKFIFANSSNSRQVLFDAFDLSGNHSKIPCKPIGTGENDFMLFKEVVKCINIIHEDNSLMSITRNIVFLSVLNRIIKKPCRYQFLQIGDCSNFSRCLAKMLKLFNRDNSLFCLTNNIPSEKESNISFISVELGKNMLPTAQFSGVFIDDAMVESLSSFPPEIFLSLKNDGNLFFLTNAHSIPQPFWDSSKIFVLADNLFLISFSVTSKIKNNLLKDTPQEKINQQKNQIISTMNNLSNIINKLEFLSDGERNYNLDHIISSLSESEKILNTIYIDLNSMYIKPYFNELKEAMIDYRLQNDFDLRQAHYEKVQNRYRMVLNEMTAQDDFNIDDKIL